MARILLVEDNPANAKLALLLLRQAGHEVVHAADAGEGIRLAQTLLPRLILMDIQLPGMDGLEATRALKADPLTRDVKVVGLTAFAKKGDEERVREAGCDGYIPKPIRYQTFLETVRATLGNDEPNPPQGASEVAA